MDCVIHHPVHQFWYLPENRRKSARVRGFVCARGARESSKSALRRRIRQKLSGRHFGGSVLAPAEKRRDCPKGGLHSKPRARRETRRPESAAALTDLTLQTLEKAQLISNSVSAELRRGRSDQGSSPSSTPPRSLSQTSPSSPRTHRLPRVLGAQSAHRRSDRHACRST